MKFEIKRQEIGRKNIFRENQTTIKVLLKFLGVKLITERKQFRFWTLSTKKKYILYVFIF